MNEITAEELRMKFHYNPETGEMTRRVSMGRSKAGDVVGWANTSGHLQVKVNKKSYLVHRLAWLYMTGEHPADEIDHRDTVKTNNRWGNLRASSNAINRQNQRIPHATNRLKKQGVTQIGNRFAARIGLNGKKRHIGLFATPDLAHDAYVKAKREIHVGCTL